ncbi:hypothetical protein Dimus_007761, partial [Dionaea muscipula]
FYSNVQVNMFTKKKFDSFGNWTSRRPWKEGKCAAKSRGNNSMQFAFPGVEPELIYYERYSGVIGCTREELFQIAGGIDYSSWGYDKCPLHSHRLSLDRVSLISSLIFEVRKKLLVAHHIYGLGQPFVYSYGGSGSDGSATHAENKL